MPGTMDTILNHGLIDEAVRGLKPVSKADHDPFEVIIDMVKAQRGVRLDTELGTDDLKALGARFRALIRARIGRDFPTDPWEQPWGAVVAVFESWHNARARVCRELNDIPQGRVTVVNVQGEDVVAGIRTPQQPSLVGSRRWAPLALVSEEGRRTTCPSMEALMPDICRQLLPMQRGDFEGLFREMDGLPVTVRRLVPPLHKLVPHDEAGLAAMAREMKASRARSACAWKSRSSSTPRSATAAAGGASAAPRSPRQARAVFDAAPNVQARGGVVKAEVMAPLVGTVRDVAAPRPRRPFCHRAGLDCVSCSPYRVPIACRSRADRAAGGGAGRDRSLRTPRR